MFVTDLNQVLPFCTMVCVFFRSVMLRVGLISGCRGLGCAMLYMLLYTMRMVMLKLMLDTGLENAVGCLWSVVLRQRLRVGWDEPHCLRKRASS